jgi:D-alanyl-D-alanine carboxypeptidase
MFAGKRRLVGLVLTSVVLVVGAVAAPAAFADRTARDRQLTKSITSTVRDASVPGAIVGVWKQGKRPYVRAFGVRNTATERRMRRNLYMRVGSVTKTFTVTALLQLVGEGKVALDDPIGKYVPGIVNGDTVTLRQLASMTSGIEGYTQSPAFYDVFVTNPYRAWTPQELVDAVTGAPALYPPGEGYNYSNTNAVLIGLVVEQVSGQSLPRYVKRHLLKPLGMKDTTFPTDAAFRSPHAQGYTDKTPDGEIANATDWNPSWGWAAGAMTSTAHDMRIWTKHLISGKRLLPPAVQRERLASVKTTGTALATYGLGLFNRDGWIGHNGTLPGYQTLVVNRPATKTTIVVLTNTDVAHEGQDTSTFIGQAITSVLTPNHVLLACGETPASCVRY